jgi:biotin carboxyl carrier protein
MAEVILMPRLSDTMTEGVIAEWHKKVGDQVKKGELLAEVETDKATMDLESYKDGTLLYTGTTKGGKIQVNDRRSRVVRMPLPQPQPRLSPFRRALLQAEASTYPNRRRSS